MRSDLTRSPQDVRQAEPLREASSKCSASGESLGTEVRRKIMRVIRRVSRSTPAKVPGILHRDRGFPSAPEGRGSLCFFARAERLHSSDMARRQSTSRSIAQVFAERLFTAIESLKAARHRIVAAVSGGPDSTALLVGLNALRRKKKLDLAAAHANHALRGEESDGDERYVRELCRRLEVPLVCRRLPVPLDAADREEGIETTARELRQHFFADAARELDAAFVATAHTADDQAETVLHRIMRGTGLAGLAGIPASRELVPRVKLLRPLLLIRRADVLEYLAAIGQDFREDRSNRDLSFTRNRVRHELIPYLTEHFNPHVTESLVRLSLLATQAQATIDGQVQRLQRRALVKRSTHHVELNCTPLRRATRFLICELLRRIWADQSWPLQEIGQEDMERIADLVCRTTGACDLPQGVRASRAGNRLILQMCSC